MQLLIDTTEKDKLALTLFDKKKGELGWVIKTTKQTSERLLLELEKLLTRHKLQLSDISKIRVNPGPGPFTQVRSGVAIANALAFALNISISEYPETRSKELVLPKYDKEPNIN